MDHYRNIMAGIGEMPTSDPAEHISKVAIRAAEDDVKFGIGLMAVTLSSLERFYGRNIFDQDDTWGISTLRQRWRARLDVGDTTARQYGFPAISSLAGRLIEHAARE